MTKKILLVRLSALGDIIHLFPAISDIRRAYPSAIIDLAVDERFVGLAGLHTAIRKVISLPLKRLKRNGIGRASLQEASERIKQLREERYDIVVDMHGVWKSALITRLARGRCRAGLAAEACAEKPAAWFYRRHYHPVASSAVQRMRMLAAMALGSEAGGSLDYGLKSLPRQEQSRLVIFCHSSSKADKLWPENHWLMLGKALAAQGYRICLPWAEPLEFERSKRLRAAIGPAACELPPLYTIEQWYQQFASCALVVGVDTGLTHLAATTSTPCIALFCCTSADLFVPAHPQTAIALGGYGKNADPGEVLQHAERLLSGAPIEHKQASPVYGFSSSASAVEVAPVRSYT